MQSFEEIVQDCVSLKKAKQSKYRRGDDPLSAFVVSSAAAGIPIHRLIFARVVDKMGRLENFLKESDTGLDIPAMIEECQDSINYLVFEIMALQRLEPSQKVVWAETLKTRIS